MTEQSFEPALGTDSDSIELDSSAKNQAPPNLDALLDQIDSVLEQNAQEFVESFVQKGGQ